MTTRAAGQRRRGIRRSVLTGLLGALLQTTGCGSARELESVRVPASGVALAYDFTPGSTYLGQVKVGSTKELEGIGSLDQSLSFDVRLEIVGPAPQDRGTLVRAIIERFDLDWTLPPTASTPPLEFERSTSDAIQGMKVTFVVGPRGRVLDMPEPPAQASPDQASVIRAITDALERAFVVLPDRALQKGESWQEREQRGDEVGPGRYRERRQRSTLEGIVRDPARGGEQLVRLEVRSSGRDVLATDVGQHRADVQEASELLFSQQGYVASVEAEQRSFDSDEGVTLTNVRATFRKAGAAADAP